MELTLWSESELQVVPARVSFPGFGAFRSQAQEVADYISSIVLTEENLKEVKKDLAAARRVVNGLNDQRIAIKKAILEEYTAFEEQIKELSGIVHDAEDDLRKKVNALEELERDQKRDALREIYQKRIWQYTFGELVPDGFDRWLKPQHLNKSTSVNQAERDMVSWMEEMQEDVDAMVALGRDYLGEFLICGDATMAIRNMDARKKAAEAAERVIDEEDMPVKRATFIITGDKDIDMTVLLLKKYNINFERK